MKKINLYNILCAFFVTLFIVACNDYDPLVVGYEDTDDSDTSINPPSIDPSWELELIPNAGQHGANVFAYKDKKYDKLFTRTLGWNGGDGVLTTLLPDGNVFWTFNDSFYGVVDEETRARGNCSFPRNSLMVQTVGSDGLPGESESNQIWLADYVQTSDPNADRYYQARTHIRHPKASLTDEEIEAGETDSDYLYWAGDATVVEKDGKNVLQVLWGAVDSNMTVLGHCLATYSLDGSPKGEDYLPGSGEYLSMISRDDDFNDDLLGYGSTLWEDEDGHTYLYTTESYVPLVARSETHDLTSQWEYYIRDLNGDFQWQTTYPTSEERVRSSIMENNYTCNMPWVFKKGDWYYMTAQTIYFGRAINIYRSKTPYGPFTDEELLFNIPYTVDKLGNQYYYQLYMVCIHPELSREGELVFSDNINSESFWDNFNYVGSADYYRPYFFRVFNWESVYDEEDEEE